MWEKFNGFYKVLHQKSKPLIASTCDLIPLLIWVKIWLKPNYAMFYIKCCLRTCERVMGTLKILITFLPPDTQEVFFHNILLSLFYLPSVHSRPSHAMSKLSPDCPLSSSEWQVTSFHLCPFCSMWAFGSLSCVSSMSKSQLDIGHDTTAYCFPLTALPPPSDYTVPRLQS